MLFFTAADFTFTTRLIHTWTLFPLWLSLFIPSGVISPLFSSSILGTNQPGEFIFQCQSFCLFILLMGFSRQEYWSGLTSLLQRITFCQSSPPWPIGLGWPHTTWLSFIELDKAVVLVWLDWLVFCDYGFSLSAPDSLSQCLLSYLGFSYLGRGVSLHSCSSKAQPLLLTSEAGVGPLSRCPCPRAWGNSTRAQSISCEMLGWMKHRWNQDYQEKYQ